MMDIKELAKEMGVTEGDVNSLMSMVCNSIKQDMAGDTLLSLSDADRVEFVNAYVQSEVKKFSEFCVTLLTKTEKRSAFDQYIYSQFKG